MSSIEDSDLNVISIILNLKQTKYYSIFCKTDFIDKKLLTLLSKLGKTKKIEVEFKPLNIIPSPTENITKSCEEMNHENKHIQEQNESNFPKDLSVKKELKTMSNILNDNLNKTSNSTYFQLKNQISKNCIKKESMKYLIDLFHLRKYQKNKTILPLLRRKEYIISPILGKKFHHNIPNFNSLLK